MVCRPALFCAHFSSSSSLARRSQRGGVGRCSSANTTTHAPLLSTLRSGTFPTRHSAVASAYDPLFRWRSAVDATYIINLSDSQASVNAGQRTLDEPATTAATAHTTRNVARTMVVKHLPPAVKQLMALRNPQLPPAPSVTRLSAVLQSTFKDAQHRRAENGWLTLAASTYPPAAVLSASSV